MDDLTIDKIDRACQLAELANDPTCNVILKPSELRGLLTANQLAREALEVVEWERDWNEPNAYHCPWCLNSTSIIDWKLVDAHAPDCLRQHALEALGEMSGEVER